MTNLFAFRPLLVAAFVAASLGGFVLGGNSALGQDVTKKDVDDLKAELANLKTQIQEINTSLASLKNLGTQLGDLNALARRVDAVEDRLDSVATDSATPSILGNMQKSAAFRQEMGKVIQGKIVVNNTTGYDQFVHINGVRWRAPAGLSYTYIPYGTVQTQLNPYDPVREWTVDDWKLVDGGHELGIGIQW